MISGTRYQLRLETNRQLRLAGEIARAQAEISSGKKILAPSDNPVGAARISATARSQADQATWRTNLDKAAALSAQADGVLTSLGVTMTRAGELMVQGANDTLSDSDRAAIALELKSLSEYVAALRNSRDSRGALLFPEAPGIRIPVAANYEVRPVEPRNQVFDAVPTPYGTFDLETILYEASISIQNGWAGATITGMDRVNAAIEHVAASHAKHGATANRIEDMIEQAESHEIVMAEERQGLESADITEVIARLQVKELSLEAAQAAFARINRSNLFDLIG